MLSPPMSPNEGETVRFPTSDAEDPPVTVIREIRVRAGNESKFEAIMRRLVEEAVHQPGHLGSTVARPQLPGHSYRFIYKFDRRSNLRAWHESQRRAELVAPLKAFIQSDRFDEYPGIETWFELPATPAPPRWKTTLMMWAAIYVLVVAIAYGMEAVGFTAPIPIRTLVMTSILVPLVAYVVGPLLGRLMHGWLHAGLSHDVVKNSSSSEKP